MRFSTIQLSVQPHSDLARTRATESETTLRHQHVYFKSPLEKLQRGCFPSLINLETTTLRSPLMLRSLLALGCKSLNEGPAGRRTLLSVAQGCPSHLREDGSTLLLQPSAWATPLSAAPVSRATQTCFPAMSSPTGQHHYSTTSTAVMPTEELDISSLELELPPSRPDLVARVSHCT